MANKNGSVVNFISCYHGYWKAFCIKAHGRLSKRRLEDLEDYQRNTGITVILVSEQADHVPRFEALNRHLKWRAGIKELGEDVMLDILVLAIREVLEGKK